MKPHIRPLKIDTRLELVDRRGIDIFPFNPTCPECSTTMGFTGYCSIYDVGIESRVYLQRREFYVCEKCLKSYIRPLKRRCD